MIGYIHTLYYPDGSLYYDHTFMDLDTRLKWHKKQSILIPNRNIYTKITKFGGWNYMKIKTIQVIPDIQSIEELRRVTISEPTDSQKINIYSSITKREEKNFKN